MTDYIIEIIKLNLGINESYEREIFIAKYPFVKFNSPPIFNKTPSFLKLYDI